MELDISNCIYIYAARLKDLKIGAWHKVVTMCPHSAFVTFYRTKGSKVAIIIYFLPDLYHNSWRQGSKYPMVGFGFRGSCFRVLHRVWGT